MNRVICCLSGNGEYSYPADVPSLTKENSLTIFQNPHVKYNKKEFPSTTFLLHCEIFKLFNILHLRKIQNCKIPASNWWRGYCRPRLPLSVCSCTVLRPQWPTSASSGRYNIRPRRRSQSMRLLSVIPAQA